MVGKKGKSTYALRVAKKSCVKGSKKCTGKKKTKTTKSSYTILKATGYSPRKPMPT